MFNFRDKAINCKGRKLNKLHKFKSIKEFKK